MRREMNNDCSQLSFRISLCLCTSLRSLTKKSLYSPARKNPATPDGFHLTCGNFAMAVTPTTGGSSHTFS